MNTKDIRIEDYQYPLPEDRIAKFPLKDRDRSKLLVYRGGDISEDVFANLPLYLPKGSLMVFNNTKVIMARLHFRKSTGTLIEVFLLEPAMPADYEGVFSTRGSCQWVCLVGNAKKWKEGRLERRVCVDGKRLCLTAERVGEHHSGAIVRLDWDLADVTFSELLDAVGELPIPPYLNRESQESDKTTYQTVYSKVKGSVAAPTAGLHFTPQVLEAVDKAGIEREEVTLHVGAGTFKPVKSDTISGHEMHAEYVCVHRHTVEALLRHQAKAIAVGTTSVRTLESLYYLGVQLHRNPDLDPTELRVGQWEPYETHDDVSPMQAMEEIVCFLDRHHTDLLQASTQIIIAPGYTYKVVDRLVTNFHQPQSTLLLLVSAFIDGDWRRVYDYALQHDFRFLSYGDSSLLVPKG